MSDTTLRLLEHRTEIFRLKTILFNVKTTIETRFQLIPLLAKEFNDFDSLHRSTFDRPGRLSPHTDGPPSCSSNHSERKQSS